MIYIQGIYIKMIYIQGIYIHIMEASKKKSEDNTSISNFTILRYLLILHE